MSRKSKVQRKLIKEKSDNPLQIERPQDLVSPKRYDLENNSSSNNKIENDFLKDSYTPISGINILSDVSNGISKKGTKRKKKNSDIIKKIKITDKVIKETPVSSLGSGVKTFYCSQNLYESAVQCDPNIMQTILPSVAMNTSCYTQTKISQSSFNSTIDDSKTVSGLDVATDDTQLTGSKHIFSQKDEFVDNIMNSKHDGGPIQSQGYIMSQLYNSQKQINQQNQSCSVQNHEYIMTQLYNSHSFVTSNQQSSSTALHQSAVATSNSMNSMTESARSTNGCMVNISENSSESVEVDCSPSNINKSQDFNRGQSTPVKQTNMHEVRKKLTFGTLAEMYHNGIFVVKDNLLCRSCRNGVSCEENCTSQTMAVSTAPYSMINNPPTEFVMQEAPNIIFNQQKLCNEHLNTETSECNTVLFDSQKFFDSFSSTPEDKNPLMLPPTLLLSNYCSEYDKAYTMKDLKPNQYRNYRHNESLRSLKEHLDSIIPSHMSLKDFYNITNLP